MKNDSLAADYLLRAQGRLKALDTLYGERLWADVVRESQEVVELALKALLRLHGIEVPRVHDVSEVLAANIKRFSPKLQKAIPELSDISQDLRRDRELAFYGSEDVTPNAFYKEKHAASARAQARKVVESCVEASRQHSEGHS